MKLLSRLYPALVFLAFSCGPLIAQNIAVKHFGVSEGLPSSECYWVMQDSRHFLWIATDAGVVKYDGYHFVTYNSSKGMPDNTVFKIHEDRTGRIWFSTYSGQFAYYMHETDSIYTIPANKILSKVVKLLPIDFCFDHKDTLWISLQLGGYVKVPPPFYKEVRHYNLPTTGFFLKEVDDSNFIYGSFKNEKEQFTTASFKSQAFFYFIGQNTPPKKNDAIKLLFLASQTSAFKLRKNTYLFSNGGVLCKASSHGLDELLAYQRKSGEIISVFSDSKNKLWVSTQSHGALLFNNDSLPGEPKAFLPDMTVTCTYEDADHGYWFTSTNNGLNYMPSLKFNYYNGKSGLSSDKVYSMAILNNTLYCTVKNLSLNILNLATKSFTYKTDRDYGAVFVFDDKLMIVDNIHSTIVDQASRSEIMILNRQDNDRKVPLKKIINADADFLLGIDPLSHIFRVSKKTGEAVLLCKAPCRASSLYKDGKSIYIGTKQGLYRLNGGQLSFLGDSLPLLAGRIEDMTGKDGTLYIATKGFGVICFKDNKITARFDEKNGLASDLCKCITMDADGQIWVGTNRGLSRLAPGKNGQYECRTLNLSNGLISNEINQVLEYRHTLYVATNDGIITFDTKEAFEQPKPIPIYIESFSVSNKQLSIRPPHELRYNDNFIKINYKGVYLRNGGDINYKYRLEGLDTNWMYTKNLVAQFTTLPAGHYRFVVYAINAGHVLSAVPATIEFNVGKAFWQTWWFRVLAAAMASILLYVWYRKRITNIRHKEEEKTAFNKLLADSEMKALRSQMNPHFIFNAMNSIQNFIIKNEAAEAQKYLTKFSRLIRSVLEDSTQETILLGKETEMLDLYMELEALRASFSFDYEIETGDSLAKRAVYIPTMLVQPYVENAILHGLMPLKDRRGRIILTFEELQGTLICRIDDNGIGREKAAEIKLKKGLRHQSMGMSVTGDRIERLNAHTPAHTNVRIIDKYENGQATGTTVIIEIKI